MMLKDFMLANEEDILRNDNFSLLAGTHSGLLMIFNIEGKAMKSIILFNKEYPNEDIATIETINAQLSKITNVNIEDLIKDNPLQIYIQKAYDFFPRKIVA